MNCYAIPNFETSKEDSPWDNLYWLDDIHWTDSIEYAEHYYGETMRETTRFDEDWD